MLFNSLTFIAFLIAVVTCYRLLENWASRKRLLLVASYIFYAAWSPPYVLLLLVSTTVDWWLARRIDQARKPGRRKLLLVLSIACNLGLLAYFKYADFLMTVARQAANMIGIDFTPIESGIVLPLAISFYTFASLSYTIDVYRGQIKAGTSWQDYALFVGFFPHLVAGPIVRANFLLPQIAAPRLADRDETAWGITLIVLGLFSKVVLSDAILAPAVNSIYAAPSRYGAIDIWNAVFSFSGQIYFDFAGYSLCAIGIAKCLGFTFPDNFHFPYAASGFSDFWRRWHISLSTWLRDYLYIPLGGNHGRWLAYRNLMITMLLGGLWHGASWMFVAWGALHGLYLVTERLVTGPALRREISPQRGLRLVLPIAFTFLVVSLTWIPFRAQTPDVASGILAGLARLSQPHSPDITLLATALVIIAMLVFNFFVRSTSLKALYDASAAWARFLILTACLCGLFLASGGERHAFIYFQF
ncbi:MAG: MBOAT family O-acyltransferase [Betaproteobacteria bacterium]